METLFALFGLFLAALMLLVGLALLIATLQGLILAFRTSLLFGAMCLIVPMVPFIVFGIVFWATGIDLPERILAAFREQSSSKGKSPTAPVPAPVPAPAPNVPGSGSVPAPAPTVPPTDATPPSEDPITVPTHIPVGPSDPVSRIASYPAVVTEGDVVLPTPATAPPAADAPVLAQPPVKALVEPANPGH